MSREGDYLVIESEQNMIAAVDEYITKQGGRAPVENNGSYRVDA